MTTIRYLIAGACCSRRSCGFRQTPPRHPARELVNKYCVSCHNQKLKTANLVLDRADAEHVVQLGGDLGKGHREAAQPCDAASGHPPSG